MKLTSMAQSVGGWGNRRPVEGPGVPSLQAGDPGIVPERGMKLLAPHIDGVDMGRAALEQDIREPAGGRADVEADPPRRLEPEGVEGSLQLQSAPRYEGVGRRGGDARIPLEEVGGTQHRPVVGRTSPAAMAA